MLHLEINITKRHIYALIAAIAVIVALLPLASYAADKFNDVPDSNIFHDDIAWLADAGVTKGCNPPDNDEFCPSDNVRRETMAAFMRRLAENQVVDAKTAITAESAAEAALADDADMLDGRDSLGFGGVASANGNSSVTIAGTSLTTDPTDLGTITATAPDDGAFMMLWSGWIRCSGPEEDEIRLFVDDSATDLFNVEECASTDNDRSVSAHYVMPVTSGQSVLFEMRGHDFFGAPNNITMHDPRISVLFVPFGIGTETPTITGSTNGTTSGGSESGG